MTVGRLIGIARKAAPRAVPEKIDRAHVGLDTGVAGDFRGSQKPGQPNHRRVTLLIRADWEEATNELGLALDWTARRANLLIDGIDLPQIAGVKLRIGDALLLEITGELDPCRRMDEVAPGLQAALTPGWRGGRMASVMAKGEVKIGDPVVVVETM